MKRKNRGIISKRQMKRWSCLVFALVMAVFCAIPLAAFANNEDEAEAIASVDVEAADDAGTADDSLDQEPDLPEAIQAPEEEPVFNTEASILTTDAEVIFYKTTTGGGDFESKTFSFHVVRVADKYGNPWTEDDETSIDNGGIVVFDAEPNKTAASISFLVRNLSVYDEEAYYYYKISEINDPDSDWNYDERAFVLRLIVFEIDGRLVVPRQGQEWFYQGVSYDAKGGGNPIPPNEYNTFINEYTGANTPLGKLRIKKCDFSEIPSYPDESFEFTLSTGGAAFDLTAPGITIRKIGGSGTFDGAGLEDGKFTLTYDTEVQIAGLPTGEYSVSELAIGYEISYMIDDEPGVGPVANVTVDEGADISIVFTNEEMDANTSLTIKKRLSGEYQSWGVGGNTFYKAKIVDARGRYLTFGGTAPNYTFSGTSATGSEIRFSENQPAIITDIPIGTTITVQEIVQRGAFYTVAYSATGIEIAGGDDSNIDVVVTNTYELDDHGVGNITISKVLAGSFIEWGMDENTVFMVRVKDATDPNNIYYLDFRSLSDGRYEAVAVGTGSQYIQLTAGMPVVLTMLWDSRVYEVEETSGASYAITYTGNSSMLPEGGNLNVTVVNTFEQGSTGNLAISKRLAGSPSDWGVDETTIFSVRVKDVTNDNYVLFDLQPDGRYLAVGNNGSSVPTDDINELVRLTSGSPVVMIGLWTNIVYEVEEVGGVHYTVTYTGNGATLPEGGNMSVTITNTYDHGTGNLVIRKSLAGFSGSQGVDENTVFTARVKDATDNNYLLFRIQQDGTYLAFANNGSGYPTSDARELVRFTAGRPAVLTGLWANHEYIVEEVVGPGYTATYQGSENMPPQTLPQGVNMNVTVTNTYSPGGNVDNGGDKGRLVIAKASFAGVPAKPDEAFTFVVMRDGSPMDLTADDIQIRKTGGSGAYIAVDLRNGRFTLTYNTEVTIDGLPLGMYSVTERAAGYITSSQVTDNSVTQTVSGAVVADITVVFSNTEIGDDPGDYPPSTPGNGNDTPDTDVGSIEEYVTVEVPLFPLGGMESPGDPDQTPGDPVSEMPRTGKTTAFGVLLPVLVAVSLGAAVFFYIRLRLAIMQ